MQNKLESNIWKIGVSTWVINDGEYSDFYVSQQVEFSLELFSRDYNFLDSLVQIKSAELFDDFRYRVVGEVEYFKNSLLVLNFGIRAVKGVQLSNEIKSGQFLSAEVSLYVNEHYTLLKNIDLPPLVYSWNIVEITKYTIPYIHSVNAAGRKVAILDEAKIQYQSIRQTNAKEDSKDGEHLIGYYLHCNLLNRVPKPKRKR